MDLTCQGWFAAWGARLIFRKAVEPHRTDIAACSSPQIQFRARVYWTWLIQPASLRNDDHRMDRLAYLS